MCSLRSSCFRFLKAIEGLEMREFHEAKESRRKKEPRLNSNLS